MRVRVIDTAQPPLIPVTGQGRSERQEFNLWLFPALVKQWTVLPVRPWSQLTSAAFPVSDTQQVSQSSDLWSLEKVRDGRVVETVQLTPILWMTKSVACEGRCFSLGLPASLYCVLPWKCGLLALMTLPFSHLHWVTWKHIAPRIWIMGNNPTHTYTL